MLIDTSLLPDLNDAAPWDDSGGDQKEKRPGVQDLSDEIESDNDTESNANIIAADDGNINSNSGESLPTAEEIRVPESTDCSMLASRRSVRNPVAKATTEEREDWFAELVKKIQNGEEIEDEEETENEQPTQSNQAVNQGDDITDKVQRLAERAKQKRAAANDGWKQCGNVPPVGIHEDIKGSDSGIAVREGKEFRQRDEMVIESREMTQPESPGSNETQGNKADSSSDNLDKVRSYRKFETERYVNDRLFSDGFLEVLTPSAVKVLLFIGSKCNGDGVCYHSHETMMRLTGLSRGTIKSSITELVKNRLIEVKEIKGKTNHYRLL
ncbi:helix-turn-helix domain-containing protein [Escherichia coli]